MSDYLRNNYLAGHEPRIMHEEILHELSRARAKFPIQDIWVTLAALTEEVGELNKAILEFTHEPHKNRNQTEIRREAVQVACMAMRVILDCDLFEDRATLAEPERA